MSTFKLLRAKLYWKPIVPSTSVAVRAAIAYCRSDTSFISFRDVPENLTNFGIDLVFNLIGSWGDEVFAGYAGTIEKIKPQPQYTVVLVSAAPEQPRKYGANMQSLMSCSGHKWCACTHTSDSTSKKHPRRLPGQWCITCPLFLKWWGMTVWCLSQTHSVKGFISLRCLA